MLLKHPAFIDLHVHLREPGQCAKGDIAHESAAAAAGGFGTIVAMANTTPVLDTPERWLWAQELIAAKAAPGVSVIQVAAMTVGREGKEPVDAAALKAAGVIALSDDGTTTQDTGVMREICWRAAEAGLLLIDHCEDQECTRRGEITLAQRDMELARETGVRMHLQHLSAAEVVEMLRDARKDGISVTGEATPHHLALTAAAVAKWGTNAKMAPPLREESDRQALIAGVVEGTLGAIATDHAPHTAAEKALPFDRAPNGIIGLEAAFTVCYETLVRSGLMSLEELVQRLTTGPAEILGIPLPEKYVEIDPEAVVRYDEGHFRSLARNCPWVGYTGHGAARLLTQ